MRRVVRALLRCGVVVWLVFVGCVGCDATTTASDSSARGNAPAVVVEVVSLDGATVEVPRGATLDIDTEPHPVEGWQARMDPGGVAVFRDGSWGRGGAITKPRIIPLKAGDTDVTLTSEDGLTVIFALRIKPHRGPATH